MPIHIPKYKNKGDYGSYYNIKILIFTFTWAGLAAFYQLDKI